MAQILTVIVVALSALSTASIIQPRGLIDDAKEQLEELKSSVQGHIYVAHDQLHTLMYEFKNTEMSILSGVGLTIDKHHSYSVKQQLDTMVNMAQAAGYDVTSCVDIREETLNSLPSRYKDNISGCMQTINGKAVKTERDARYIVDIIMSKVHHLENQLNRCREDILCISPLLTEIELNQISMPQNIKTEMQTTESLFTTMSLSLQTCGDSNVSDYTAESGAILREIQDCIDGIMG